MTPVAESKQITLWQSLRMPVIVLAFLIVAVVAGFRAIRSGVAGSNPIFERTAAGWRELPSVPGYPESLHVSGKGTVWLRTWGPSEISRWDGAAWHFYKETESAPKDSFSGLDFALDGEEVWAPSEDGVLHWDGQRWQRFGEVKAGEGSSLAAGGGQAWVIDPAGLFSTYRNGSWESHKLELPGVVLAGDAASDADRPAPQLARTDDGIVWLLFQGIWRLKDSSWTRVADADDGTFLVGAMRRRLWFNDSTGLRFVASAGDSWIVSPPVQTGLGDTSGIVDLASEGTQAWFASSTAVLEFDGARWRETALPGSIQGARKIAAGADGTLWVIGVPRHVPARILRFEIIAIGLLPVLALGALYWIFHRLRRRSIQQHRRVSQAVQHATGEIPEELQQGEQKLARGPGWGGEAIIIGIGSGLGYLLLRMIWPKTPAWAIPVLGLAIHFVFVFRASLVKRKPKPSDPLGPGAPSRYDWGKTWQALGGASFLIALLVADRLAPSGFLGGHVWWLLILLPAGYQMVMVRFFNSAIRRCDYDAALKIVRGFYFYNPSAIDVLRMSGHVLVLAGRYREAEEMLRRGMASSRASQSYGFALEHLGDALMEQGRYDEATRSYEAALLAFPEVHRLYRGMAEMLLRQGKDPRRALEYIEKIIDLSGVSPRQRKLNGRPQDDYWSLKAWAMARAGLTSEVPHAIENALKATKESCRPDMAATHYRAGMAMQALGNLSAANEYFRLAVEFDPQGRRGTLAQTALQEGSVWGRVKV